MKLHFRGLSYDLKKNSNIEMPSDFFKTSLNFLKRWRSGQESFEFATSGSTGNPKVISLTRKQMQASARATIEFFNLNSNHTAWLCLQPHYIAGAMMLVRADLAQMDLVLTEPSSTLEFDFGAPMPTLVSMVPQQAQNFKGFSQLKIVLLGGMAVNHSLKLALSDYADKIWETYGMTETASHIALKSLNQSYFQALPHLTLGQDPRGCLTVKGEVTNHVELITNDRVEFSDANQTQFRWLGRADNVINSGGIKISPERLETQIEQDLGVEVYFSSKPCSTLGEKMVLAVEPNCDWKAVYSFMERTFSRYLLPKEVVVLKHFPLNPNGKIMRSRLKEMVLEESSLQIKD
jgi:O-succinylbenzoic acid--CoA ligase